MRSLNRHKHPRLKGYDYSRAGAYFVTICTHERAHLFGCVRAGTLETGPRMDLNRYGAIVQRCWDAIPGHYPNVELDAFQIMPDHLHGIIVIVDPLRSRDEPAEGARHAATLRGLANILGSFKSAISKGVNELRLTPGSPVWQKGYYDHVIRNNAEHDRIAQYIAENPAKWAIDHNNS